jgi:undecaprenyl-phosphate 4-deoxy-4-formamido-L-arabinose transferase
MFTGFSIFPLRLASFMGVLFSFVSFLLVLFFTYTYIHGPIFFHRLIPPGWASIVVSITFLGGIQLIVVGLIGEYLGRLFLTANKVPQYVIKNIEGF